MVAAPFDNECQTIRHKNVSKTFMVEQKITEVPPSNDLP